MRLYVCVCMCPEKSNNTNNHRAIEPYSYKLCHYRFDKSENDFSFFPAAFHIDELALPLAKAVYLAIARKSKSQKKNCNE